MKDARSDSSEQREAEQAIRCLLEEDFGPLNCGFWRLSDDLKVEVDAVSKSCNVAIEIVAHQGKLLDGQKKIAKDMLKLALISADSDEVTDWTFAQLQLARSKLERSKGITHGLRLMSRTLA